MNNFTEQTEYKIEVIPPHSILQVRRADLVLKDGEVVGRTYHRHCVMPGDDTSNEPAEVQAVAKALHTPECCAAYNSAIQEAQALMPGNQTSTQEIEGDNE